MSSPRRALPLSLAAVFLLGRVPVGAATAEDPAAGLGQAMAAAEASLQKGDLGGADAHFREALVEGWVLRATLENREGRWAVAREALRTASLFRVPSPPALRSLGVAELQIGDPTAAAEILAELAARTSNDPEALRLLARALAAAGRPDEAARKLEAAAAATADDPEQTFLVAVEYLWIHRVEAAERLFASVVDARPIPQTRVLVGRSFRDAGEYERARIQLRKALELGPAVRRAHYYLGMIYLADTTAVDRLDNAIAEFQEELKLAPADPLASEQLGLALLDAGRPEEALAALETATKEDPRAVSFAHLARAQLALGRAAEAVTAGRRGLALAEEQGADDDDLGKIHYQLGLALRKTGPAAEAAAHLAKARELASHPAAPPDDASAPIAAAREASPLAPLSRAERYALALRVREGLVRAYFNLGILQTQLPTAPRGAERFVRAAAFLEKAAEIDPEFPQVQSSLGVAFFNARQFDKATGPLARAVTSPSADPGLRRMLAIAYINTRAYDKAAPLLRDDPQRASEPSLQTAYGLSLLKSGRPAEAEKILAAQISARGEAADLLVLLGQAQAEQKKQDLAIASLRRALELDAKAADADATLGGLYLRRGQAEDAARHLEAAARLVPADASLQEQLGQAYQKLGRADLASQHFEAARQLQARP